MNRIIRSNSSTNSKTRGMFRAVSGAAMAAVLLSASAAVAQMEIGDPMYGSSASVTAMMSPNGTLTISGTGRMLNWPSQDSRPWYGSASAITSVVIEEGVTNIGYQAFRYCDNLVSVTIPNTVTEIGGLAFGNCSKLTDITLPNSLTKIEIRAFDHSGLTSITIPDGMTTIDENAFQNSWKVESVTIPASVTEIGFGAFTGIYNITSITCLNPVPPSAGNQTSDTYESAAFNRTTANEACLYVPEESINDYKDASVWKEFKCVRAAENVSVRPRALQTGAVSRRITVHNRTLTVSLPSGAVSTVRLIDMRGKTAARFRVGESGAGSFSLAKVPAGRYLVEMRNADKRVSMGSVVVGVR